MPDTTIPPREYDGGFDTADNSLHLRVTSEADEDTVDFHATLRGRGPSLGSCSIYKQLTPAEARELSLALDAAAEAAEATAHSRNGLPAMSLAAVSG